MDGSERVAGIRLPARPSGRRDVRREAAAGGTTDLTGRQLVVFDHRHQVIHQDQERYTNVYETVTVQA